MNMYAVGTEVGLGTGTLYETSACDLDWNKIDVLILSNQYFIIKILNRLLEIYMLFSLTFS